MTTSNAHNRTVSFFEFWPSWVIYFPVALQWIILAVRYRSLTLPFLANPSLALSGMVGLPKSTLMRQATSKAADLILPWVSYIVTEAPSASQAQACIEEAAQGNIILPFVCKPDIGCRGVGVKLVNTEDELAAIIKSYPAGATLLCQTLASYEPEVGIFYVKTPQTGQCDIPSMTIKTLPRVVGDGVHTLGQLISNDPRAGQLQFLYHQRHRNQWNTIPDAGQSIRLVFSASHSKGAIFTDARHHITPALTQAIDDIMRGLPDFYYGRLDVKFKDIESLKEGRDLQIIEINGASSESIHIWDKDTSFTEAIRALLWQYRTLFRIGAYHRSQGKTPPRLREFFKGWQLERHLTRHYPLTD